MANKYVQYGAVVTAATVMPAVVKGVSAGISRGTWLANNLDYASPTQQAAAVTSGAVDAGTTAFSSTLSSTISNPAFLTTVGLGLAGLALGSGSKRPSLSFPNLAATAAVALNVANLIQQGKAAAASLAQTTSGIDIGSKVGPPVALRAPLINDPTISTDEARTQRQTFRLVYPDDLTSNYYIRFGLYRYERLDKANRSLGNTLPHTTIRLPIPANLIDAISLAYQDVGLGMFGGAAFEGLMGRLNGPQAPGNGQGEIMRHATAAAGSLVDLMNDPNFMTAVARRLAANVDPGLGAAFDLATGTAPNPHMSVSFQGVSLKKYQFNWRFSPNNQKESKILEQIIRNLQASALPEKNGKFLLTFPDVVKVEMMPSNLFIFKPMMIDNVSVNYAPSGSPSFFKGDSMSFDRYPTEMEVSISLREIDIHTASDADYKTVRNQQNNSDPASKT